MQRWRVNHSIHFQQICYKQYYLPPLNTAPPPLLARSCAYPSPQIDAREGLLKINPFLIKTTKKLIFFVYKNSSNSLDKIWVRHSP